MSNQDTWIPIGGGKGTPAETATLEQLQRFLAWFRDQPQGSKEHDKYLARARHAREVLRNRANGGDAQPSPPAAAPWQAPRQLTTTDPLASNLARVTDSDELAQRFAGLAKKYHLVVPVKQIDVLPPGWGASVAFVEVDPDPRNGQVYELKGKKGFVALHGQTIMELASSAEVSWLPSIRTDDGRDPFYCQMVGRGVVRSFDGTMRLITGEVAVDARDGSPYVLSSQPAQVQMMRKHLLSNTASRARNRAFCSCLAVPRSYRPADLAKPFAIARLTFTGQTDDPELRREFALMTARAALQATTALYGEGGAAATVHEPELPPPPPPKPAPPVETSAASFDAEEEFEPWG